MKKQTILFTLALLMVGVTGVKAEVTGSWSDYRDATWGTDYESASTFTITNAEQLAQFAYMVNSGSDFSDKTVTLTANITLQQETGSFQEPLYHYWVPIGNSSTNSFKGTFNGNNKEIGKVTISSENSYQGLFGYIGTGGTIQNLSVNMCTISGNKQVGGLAGYNGGTVQNCLVKNMMITGTGTDPEYIGAIIGQNAGSVSGCYCYYSINSQPDLQTKSVGQANSTMGADIAGASRLYYATKSDGITITHGGTSTGQIIGGAEIYDNGVKEGVFFFKPGATATLTYDNPGYVVTYSVEGEGSSITNSTLTVGTENFSISVATKEAAEWSGSGDSADDPYIIYNREQLDMLANRVNNGTSTYQNKFFRLEDYISYSDDQDFSYTAIGSADHPFCGTFDGNGNEIIYGSSVSTGSYVGYFGYNKGTIKNLSVSRSHFQGCGYVGIIAGYNEGTIENCRVKGGSAAQIGGNGQYFGGVAGYNKGIIKTTVCAANVRSGFDNDNLLSGYTVSCSGGIAGYNADGATIENCLYLGRELMGSAYVGAIAGQNAGTLTHNLYHNNGYAAGDGSGYVADHIGTDVKGVGTDGSITGNDTDHAMLAKVVKLDYDIALVAEPTTVTTTNPNDKPVSVYANGILFDDSYFGNEMDNAFYTTATTVGLTYTETVPSGYEIIFTVEEGANSSISGSTLTIGDDVVEVSATEQRVPDANSWLAATNRAASFSTTGENSITITSAAELGLLAYNVNFGGETYTGYTITLGANINLAGHTWEPIAYGVETAMSGDGGFLGTFDGAGLIIRNMNVDYPMYAGLFSIVPSGVTVKNVTISNAQVKGQIYVGVVAGACYGTIENCHVSYGNVELDTDSNHPYYIGGIAGMCGGGSIKGCTVMGTNIKPSVADAMGIGGIVGGISPNQYITATLMDCLFAGNIQKVEGNTGVGAIVGTPLNENTITNNYYIDGTNQQATPNTVLKAIGGADIENGAELAYAYDQLPAGIGNAGTQYNYSGVIPYDNGLHYALCYYMPIAPTVMDITLSNNGDNSTLLSTYNGITGKVTLGGRTFNKNGLWYTICLPFTIDDINAKDGNDYIWPFGDDNVEVQRFTGASFAEGELSLTFMNCKGNDEKTPITAGHPYLIRWNNTSGTIANPVFNNVTISAIAPIGDTSGGVTFIGTFVGQSFAEDNRSILLIGANNNQSILFYPQTEASLGAQRAYFQLDGFTAGDINNGARLFFGDDDATGINDNGIMINDHEAGAWYTIDGLKLSGKPTRKGLYIHNNRVVNIK